MVLVVLLLLTSPHSAGPARAGETKGPHVSFVSGGTVYVTVGRDDGLRVGDRLEARRSGRPAATLEIVDLASHSASCRILEPGGTVDAGDPVELPRSAVTTPIGPNPGQVAETLPPSSGSPPAERPRTNGRRDGILRGSIDLRMVAADDRVNPRGDYIRPSFDLRMSGERLGGADFGLEVRIQTRRTFVDQAATGRSDESRMRVYRAAGRWEPRDSGWQVTAGRQVSSDLSRVSSFDGVLGEYAGARWSAGAFSGTQPDPRDYGYATEIREHGGFLKYERRGSGPDRWSLTGGVVGSYHASGIDREYVFGQWRRNGRTLSANLGQEVDVNRGWKRSRGERTLSATNANGSCRYRLSGSTAVEAGFDDRRAIRLYRYKETPETAFDDSHRQGVWLGASQSLARRHQIALRSRVSTMSSARTVRSVNATYTGSWPELSSLHVRARSSRFVNTRVSGWLHSVGVGGALGSGLALEVTQGIRLESAPRTTATRVYWGEIDLDFRLGRRWSSSTSVEYNHGPAEDHRRYYSGLRYRL